MNEDLVRVLEDQFDDMDPNMDPTPTYGQLTFLELVEDLKTRPFFDINDNKCYYLSDRNFPYGRYNAVDSNGRYISKLEQMLWSIVKYSKPEELKENLGVLADMKVNDWLEELRSLLDSDNHGCEETWT